MRLQVLHRTEYSYPDSVTDSSNELRLIPPTTRYQTLESSFLVVLPATRLTSYEDLNENRVSRFEIPQPHRRLTVESRCTVRTKKKIDFEKFPYGFLHSQLPVCRRREDCHIFLQDSHYIERTPQIWREALDIQGISNDVFQTSYLLMESIFENYSYEPGRTSVSTHASEVLEEKAGVCQDFAHAMVALCRSIEIPARYVSGYFFDATRDHSLRGSEASHAWAEVYIEGSGWIGFDPTNNKVVDDTYIILARGRDYADVAPITGTYYGTGPSAMRVSVIVDRLPEKGAASEVEAPLQGTPDSGSAAVVG